MLHGRPLYWNIFLNASVAVLLLACMLQLHGRAILYDHLLMDHAHLTFCKQHQVTLAQTSATAWAMP